MGCGLEPKKGQSGGLIASIKKELLAIFD